MLIVTQGFFVVFVLVFFGGPANYFNSFLLSYKENIVNQFKIQDKNSDSELKSMHKMAY